MICSSLGDADAVETKGLSLCFLGPLRRTCQRKLWHRHHPWRAKTQAFRFSASGRAMTNESCACMGAPGNTADPKHENRGLPRLVSMGPAEKSGTMRKRVIQGRQGRAVAELTRLLKSPASDKALEGITPDRAREQGDHPTHALADLRIKQTQEVRMEIHTDGDHPHQVTEPWIRLHASDAGGWSAKQLGAIGVSWPPEPGWIARSVGLKITQDDRRVFETSQATPKERK